jgi:hypothetical protein
MNEQKNGKKKAAKIAVSQVVIDCSFQKGHKIQQSTTKMQNFLQNSIKTTFLRRGQDSLTITIKLGC